MNTMQASQSKGHSFGKHLAFLLTILAFIVVSLGAYTRLNEAGLGCPDWPGCYQQWTVPSSEEALAHAAEHYPDTPVEAGKAWLEMIHRYVAGLLGLGVFLLSAIGWFKAKTLRPLWLLLPALTIFQAALGMWTVTLKLLPLSVMGHLLGGFSILSCLWIAKQRWLGTPLPASTSQQTRLWCVSLILLIIQIFLGGWTSANYAALSCLDFPACQSGVYFPLGFDWHSFNILRGLGELQPLSAFSDADRMAIHMSHRLIAIAASLGLCLTAWAYRHRSPRNSALLIIILIAQLVLGITNVLAFLPLPIAMAHHATAALLLLTLLTLRYRESSHATDS